MVNPNCYLARVQEKTFHPQKINNEHAFDPCKQVDISASHCFSLALGDLITSQVLQEFHPMTTLITQCNQCLVKQQAGGTAELGCQCPSVCREGANRTVTLRTYTLIKCKNGNPSDITFFTLWEVVFHQRFGMVCNVSSSPYKGCTTSVCLRFKCHKYTALLNMHVNA